MLGILPIDFIVIQIKWPSTRKATRAYTDIGVMVQDDLKPSLHCAKVAAKANGVLGQLSRAVLHRDSITYIKLYLVYVTPTLGPWSTASEQWKSAWKRYK